MRLILLGPPGAGKGTQAAVLSRKFNALHISTGDLLREAVNAGTAVGLEAKCYMERGELVPDEIVTRMLTDKLRESKAADFILDGFPRTRRQAELLDKSLAELKLPPDMVLYFDTNEQTILTRLTGRRVCRNCGFNFHVVNIPPRQEGICDHCGGELYQRKDDCEETIRTRIEVYNNQTRELIDYYDREGILKTVSGDLDVKELNAVLDNIFAQAGLK